MSTHLDLDDVAATSEKAQAELLHIMTVLSNAEFLMRKAGQIPGPMQDSFKRAALDVRAILNKDGGIEK